LYKQRLNVKKIQNKFLNLIKLLFPWKYRFAFHSVPICLVPSTEMSSTEYRNVAYVQYRDVQVPSCPDTLGYTLWFSLFSLKLNIFPFSASFLTFSMQNHLILMYFTHFDITHFFCTYYFFSRYYSIYRKNGLYQNV
jgi:hypothetical protein